jgi:divalent metal cation (Fe/Co/Zn/Cd) transporter
LIFFFKFNIFFFSDHRNDVLTNAFGIGAAAISSNFPEDAWWVDSVGGIIIGLYVMQNWLRIGIHHVTKLTGLAASPKFLQQLTYITLYHDKRIIKIDTVRAFHLG